MTPLTPGQERLWFLHRLDPADASYNMPVALRIHGSLDRTALRRVLTEIVTRHDVLRSRFTEQDGTPACVIVGDDIPLVQRDASRETVREHVAGLANRPFDLADGPVARFTLFRIAPDDHVLCLVLHHIVADGWSVDILLRELADLYEAFIAGRPSALPPLPIRYADHVRRLRDEATGTRTAYWTEALKDAPPLELPTDRPRPATRSTRGAQVHREIPPGLVATLESLARAERATIFMVFLTAFQILLARHCGQRDITIATPIIGRNRVDTEPLIGYFTGLIMLRTEVSGDVRFRDLLRTTRNTALRAYDQGELPFGAPFEAMFMYMRTQSERPRLADLTVEIFDSGLATAKTDLSLDIYQGPTQTGLTFTYDTDLFDPESITALTTRFLTLLTAIATHPETEISRLTLIPPAELAQLHTQHSGASPIGQLFKPGASLVDLLGGEPDSTAIACDGQRLTYRALADGTDQLATALRKHGIGPGHVVAVRLARTLDLVPTLLAIWRTGAAYLPIDPEYPDERASYLLSDSGASLIIESGSEGGVHVRLGGRTGSQPFWARLTAPMDAEKTPHIPRGGRASFGTRDTPHESIYPDERATDPLVDGKTVRPEDAAYVIYTSGSTGAPKGVVVERRSVAARVRWMAEAYGLGPGDRIAQFAELGFDAHAEEIFPALAAGAGVVMVPDGGRSFPDFLRTPAGRRVTVLDLPTAYWHELVRDLDGVAWPEGLRLVILGGEQVGADAVLRWRRRFGDRVRLVNTYGPTEATVIATAADIGGKEGNPPIGRPIGETTVRVVDEYGELVPIGVAGELLIGGVGVARGYLGRPGLTAERFIPDADGPPGSRMYRTGDRVCWRRDGQLEFLGRFDDQVKVRGFRIEPGEIESRLAGCPGVRQAVVIARDGDLVAYVAGTASHDDLRRQVVETLPPHLVPTHWVTVDSFPLTVNGKLDRNALPAPAASPGAYIPPRSEAEELVAEIWADVLGLDRVGAGDDFFTLGGHSLLATRVIARIRHAADLAVPVRTLFTRRTVAEFAQAVEAILEEAERCA
ncbi:amino acid adenylation domain-containing protein [Acrocarpospora sp. B8E8]|uniref:amino acid adenylation domain-containing protein n=1 Tax=Acrocarpospora sp. B8E8 TaxID=3153572 RepID=UPI00325D0AE3